MKDLRNKREQLMAQLDEMVTTVETEVRSLNAEEVAKFNEVKAEIENIDATIAMVEEKRAKEMGTEKELVENTELVEYTDESINDNLKMGNEVILIIHGIGTGIIRNVTTNTLKKNNNNKKQEFPLWLSG